MAEWQRRLASCVAPIMEEVRTSIGWQASPRSTTRPALWTQVSRGRLSIKRQLSVEFTCERSFCTLVE